MRAEGLTIFYTEHIVSDADTNADSDSDADVDVDENLYTDVNAYTNTSFGSLVISNRVVAFVVVFGTVIVVSIIGGIRCYFDYNDL